MANLDENISRFMMAKDRARRIIQMDANGSLDKITENAKKSGKMSYDSDGMVNTTLMEHKTQETPSYQNVSYQANSGKSKLPKEILESFANNNIDTSMLGVDVGQSSILDQLDSMTNGGLFTESRQPSANKPRVQENTIQQQPTVVNPSVDYSMIKMIVEDCMKKYTSALKKSLLSESKATTHENNLQAMKIGDKFSFIDNEGNLYEAKMTFVKNINSKKRV